MADVTTRAMKNNTIAIEIPDSAFAAPEHAAAVLDAALRRLLDEVRKSRLREAKMLLPLLHDIEAPSWAGAKEPVKRELESFRAEAERLTAAFVDGAEKALRAARLEEQKRGHVAKSPVYRALDAVQAEPLTDWEADVKALADALDEPEAKFAKRLRAVGTGRLGRGAAYDALVAACEKLLTDGSSAVVRRCSSILRARVFAYAHGRLAAFEQSRRDLVTSASDGDKARARQTALAAAAVARGETSARHDASMPPDAALIEQVALAGVSFTDGHTVRLDAFWPVFGAWATARGELPAEEACKDGASFSGAMRAFLHEQARSIFGPLTLGELYARTGAPLPLTSLIERSRIPLDLRPLANAIRQANQEVAVVVVPDGLQGVHLPAQWHRAPGADPNRLALLQDLRGVSGRAVLGLNRPEWEAALDPDAIAREASTTQLRAAVRARCIVERLQGAPAEEGDSAVAPPAAAPAGAEGPRTAPGLPVDRGPDGAPERHLAEGLAKASGNGSVSAGAVRQ